MTSRQMGKRRNSNRGDQAVELLCGLVYGDHVPATYGGLLRVAGKKFQPVASCLQGECRELNSACRGIGTPIKFG
jgi:hypothetical protein